MSGDDFGLSVRDVATLHTILKKYEAIRRVYIFGSRALGSFKKGSDIDLAIMNEGVPEKMLTQLVSDFSDSSLPYRVDLVDITRLNHKELTEHIDRVGVLFYKREE
jgi:predicted nucleotidyltransferase